MTSKSSPRLPYADLIVAERLDVGELGSTAIDHNAIRAGLPVLTATNSGGDQKSVVSKASRQESDSDAEIVVNGTRRVEKGIRTSRFVDLRPGLSGHITTTKHEGLVFYNNTNAPMRIRYNPTQYADGSVYPEMVVNGQTIVAPSDTFSSEALGFSVERGTADSSDFYNRTHDLSLATAQTGTRAMVSKAEVAAAQSKFDRELGVVLLAPIAAGAAAAAVAAVAPATYVFALVNAGKISAGGGIVAEGITGVSVMTPVGAGVGIAALNAAERAYGPTFKGLLSDIRAADFSTPKNGAVFWTGFREGNQARAMQWASQNGKLTIETTPGGRWLESLDLYGPNSRVSIAEADNLWRAASAQYARGASGQINAFTVGAPLNRANAYYGVELPKLTASPNVVQPIIVR